MANTMKPIPEGYHSVTPYMICKGAAEAIEFYKNAFGAVEVMRMAGPNGRIGHAEIRIGDSHIMSRTNTQKWVYTVRSIMAAPCL